MVEEIDADHKVAFFLTDGECGTKRYLESLRLQALEKGIKLVGIGLGVKGDGLPNGMTGRSAADIAPSMMDHLCQLLKEKIR